MIAAVQPRVVLDANVLFPFTVRDTLLRAAALGLFQVVWSEAILDEAMRNLIATGRMSEDQVRRLVAAMQAAFPEALVHGYEALIPSMTNQEKDRHVAAVAVKAGAKLVVTRNLRDFEPMPDGVEVRGPDDFLLDLLDLRPSDVIELLRAQAAALTRPPVSLDELLTGLGKTVPRFEAAVRARLSARGGDAI
ncbi:MAG: PIN domain-containing protein [Myxococcales bacterium]|nr:PIN domain-containing protein [Myxococcales bacterium]MCB9534128.1 PIN domain-containing protein [Myxococcales bacterium]